MTRTEMNYRFPDRCCGRCRHSYQNSYKDNQCRKMEPTDNIIDIGGDCDMFEADNSIGASNG
jgi:hypothetical protein